MLLIKSLWTVIFIPLIVGVFRYRYFDKGLKRLFFFVILGTITEITTKVAVYNLGISNSMPIGHFYIATAFFLIAAFFLYHLNGFLNKKIITGIILFFEIFAVINAFFIQSPLAFPSISGATGAAILIFFSILLFIKIMEEGKIKNLVSEPIIWINSAILIYYASNFFFYILNNIILNSSRAFYDRIFLFFAVFNAIFYILVGVGFWKTKKR